MSRDERELLEGLHALASDGRRGASSDLEARLKAEFRKRSRLRRAKAWMSAAAAGAIAAAIGFMVWIGPFTPRPAAVPDTSMLADDSASGFYPLPDADALPPVESAMVVRVQMPTASLELIGYPINRDPASEPVDAEVLLGQDGLARGVRLVE